MHLRQTLCAGVATAAFYLIAASTSAHAAEGSEGEAANAELPKGSVLQSASGRVFLPEDFAQFAPRNALDMVTRVPGFTINDGNQGQRGLGQANQNVIVNGERFSSKSASIRDQLSRISAADVMRIEIIDGNALDIPGLSGQVANVVYRADKTSGQFSWRGGFRPHNTDPQLIGGEISLSGKSGQLEYTVALSNDNERFGADGPTLITAGDGSLIETQFSRFKGGFDNPRLSTSFSRDFGSDVSANLNLSYQERFVNRAEPETGLDPSGLLRTREADFEDRGPRYEVGGDIAFPAGPGTFKLIGLERFERSDTESVVVDRFSDGRDSTGFRFEQLNEVGERIGRLEYGWQMWAIDWQISGEAAFNRLNRNSQLSRLDPAGTFVPIPLPGGTGGVTEDRYETILSASTKLSPAVSLQFSGGAEFSTIEQTGMTENSRSFTRPKGSAAIGWKPGGGWDASFEVSREVGQLSFGDFLANVSLNTDNQTGANSELVPMQSWNFDLELNKRLGAFGSAKLEVRHALFEDFVDFFPLRSGGEARGNIGNATRTQIELNTTLNGAPIGFKGARLEVRAIQRWMNVTDPLTGEDRPFSGDLNRLLNVNFRHDIPSSDWAWGSGLFTNDTAPFVRRREIGRGWEGPAFVSLFAEHKDVAGLTVRATWSNVLEARNMFERTVFAGDRPSAPVLFHERMDRRIGPIFRFSVSGNF